MKNFDHEVAAITGAASGMGAPAFLPHLRASGEGHGVNTCGLVGLMAMPLNGNCNPPKFAVHGCTESAALQILRAVEPNQRRMLVGRDARWAYKPVRLMGARYRPRMAAARRTARRI